MSGMPNVEVELFLDVTKWNGFECYYTISALYNFLYPGRSSRVDSDSLDTISIHGYNLPDGKSYFVKKSSKKDVNFIDSSGIKFIILQNAQAYALGVARQRLAYWADKLKCSCTDNTLVNNQQSATDNQLVIKRRQVPASGVSGYYLVYILEKDGQEVEIGKTTWNDMNAVLGVVNSYEEGLLVGLRVFCDKDIKIIREK